jgi:hypothetical protein
MHTVSSGREWPCGRSMSANQVIRSQARPLRLDPICAAFVCSHRGQSWAQQFCTWYALASGFRVLSLSHYCVYMHPRGRRIAACYIDHNCMSGSKQTGFDWLMEMGRNRLGRRTINRGESFDREMSCKNGWMQELFASFLYRLQVLYISLHRHHASLDIRPPQQTPDNLFLQQP